MNGNGGSYLGGVALGRPGVVGAESNTSIALDGVNDTVSVPSSASLGSASAVSIECWIDVGALPSGTSTIVRKDGQYLVRLTSGGTIVFRLWKGGTIKEIQTPLNAITPGTWHHVMSTWDGATMTVYVDGTPRVTGALAAPADVKSSGLYLGSSYASYDWYAGRLDEAAVYALALPAARVRAHYDTALALDTTAPDISLAAPAGGSTTDAWPTFGGSGGTSAGDSAIVTVDVYSGAGASGLPLQVLTTARRAAGTFSVRPATALPSGTYTAIAGQADSSGNVGRSAPTTFTVDAEADPVLLAAGDIAACDTTGDEATAALLDRLAGTVATAGDHAYEYDTADDFTYCYDPTWGRHKARTLPTIGDHEYRTPNATPYFDYFGAAAGDSSKGYYSYDLGAWHVVSVNTNCGQIGGCGSGSPEEQWLRADLAAHPAACTLAVLHDPRFSSGGVHGSDPAMQPFWQALYDYGAELVVSGNDHLYERFAPQTPAGDADQAAGIRQWVVGTGGRSHYAFGTIRPNSEVRNNDTFGVLALTLHATSYAWQFVAEAGKTFTDVGSTPCH